MHGAVWPCWASMRVDLDIWVAPCGKWDPDALLDVVEVLTWSAVEFLSPIDGSCVFGVHPTVRQP